MIGQHKRNLNPVPYSREWKVIFEQEAELLRYTLRENALQIEHIGSTSIPGVDAKPVIDIMVAVNSLKKAAELIPVLEKIGYEYRSPDPVPERMFFAKENKPDHRTHHLNLTEKGSGFWRNQILFRDYLRDHSQIAAEYVDLKVQLAKRYAQTGILDREGKTDFVMKVLALAKKESSK
jgi:GrpB-like predicted nucleotidyltransferase (UPF0157 family)